MAIFDIFAKKKSIQDDLQYKRETADKLRRVQQALRAKHEEENGNTVEYFTMMSDFDQLITKIQERSTTAAATGKVNKPLEAKISEMIIKLEAISKYNGLSICTLVSFVAKSLNSLFDVYNGATRKNGVLDDKMQADICNKLIDSYHEYIDVKDKVEAIEKQIAKIKEFAHQNPSQIEKCKQMILAHREEIARFDRQIQMSSRAVDQLLRQAGVITEGEYAKRIKENVTVQGFEKRMHENTKAMEDLYEQFEENDNIMAEYDEQVTRLTEHDKQVNLGKKKTEDIQLQMEAEQFEEKRPTTLDELDAL